MFGLGKKISKAKQKRYEKILSIFEIKNFVSGTKKVLDYKVLGKRDNVRWF